MSVCGNYAKHYWTGALRARDRVCVRCGLPYWDRSEAFFESPLQQFIPSLLNAKTPRTESRRSSKSTYAGVRSCKAGVEEIAQGWDSETP
jgi:hypothetical protein